MKRIEVAAAVIRRGDQICLSRRHQHVHQGGKWEFPGGKVEPGESVLQALTRELQEELGIKVESAEPLIEISHNYPDKSVCLKVMGVTEFQGEPEGMEGQEVRWVAANELKQYEFPEANVPILSAALLPRSYVITPSIGNSNSVDDFIQGLSLLAQQGHRLIQIRCKDVDQGQWSQLLPEISLLKEKYHIQFLVNSAIEWASDSNLFDGVHLTSADLLQATARPNGYQWVAASCHNLEQINRAERLGVDFITLSPYSATASHPQAAPLDRNQFLSWVAAATLPVYALGGVSMDNLQEVIASGGQGVAGISGFWPS